MRSTALRLTLVASAALAAVPAVASHAVVPVSTTASTALGPLPSQQCSTNRDIASVNVAMRSGHAVGGDWTLRPIFACQDAENDLTVHASLTRNGRAFLTSDGTCTSTIPACTTVAGTVRRAQLGVAIRGSYVLHLTVTITGVDAALTQGCGYSPTTLTATCTATSAPVVIR